MRRPQGVQVPLFPPCALQQQVDRRDRGHHHIPIQIKTQLAYLRCDHNRLLRTMGFVLSEQAQALCFDFVPPARRKPRMEQQQDLRGILLL